MFSSFLSFIVVCSVIAIAQPADDADKRSIIGEPLNDAIEFGPSILLNCEASSPLQRVQWTEYTTNANGAPISDNDFLLPGHPNYARYTLENPAGSAIYNLVIDPTIFTDGGTYQCADVSDSSVRRAEIVMLEGTPNCTTNIPEDGHVREDQYYTIECIIGYRGNVAPVMTWTGPDPDEWGPWGQASATTNVSVWSGINMNMTRFFDAKTFSVLVNFTEAGFIRPNSATNVPTWNFTFSTAPLFVQWAPQRMYRVPEKDSYEIGDTIECWADANPAAEYFWRNLDTQEVWNGQVLPITEALVGSWRMQCNAKNTISGSDYTNDYFFALVVNPRTTTPEPTTPTTTTEPPAEAPCDDLTGRWSASSPTVVDMCVEIDKSRNGRVVGLFRNATDPYFIDIRGRVAPGQYNQIGFTGVWPANIGTLAFNGICRKCRGTEILQLTGIGRRVIDNPSCLDPGPKYTFADYSLRRTGPPCRALFEEYKVKY